MITHRPVSVNADRTLVTKGDANKTPDPWGAAPADVIGTVSRSIPAMGYWLVYFKSAPGWDSALFACVGVCLMWSIAREFNDSPDVTTSDDADNLDVLATVGGPPTDR